MLLMQSHRREVITTDQTTRSFSSNHDFRNFPSLTLRSIKNGSWHHRLDSVQSKGESVDELIELRLSRPSYQGLSTCILAKSSADVRCLQTVLAHKLKVRVGTRACIRRQQLWLLKRDGCVHDWEPRRFFPVRISGARVLLSPGPEQAKSVILSHGSLFPS